MTHNYTQVPELNDAIARLHPEDDIVWIDTGCGMERCKTLTTERAKTLKYRETVYAKHYFNADGTNARYRVNGKVKVWKTRPQDVKVPMKRGLYETGYIDQGNVSDFLVAVD